MNKIEKKYGYKVGSVYELIMDVEDERKIIVPAGTLVTLVAIAPKVRIINIHPHQDSKEYFYNAVRFPQVSEYDTRIRANFVTLKKKEVK